MKKVISIMVLLPLTNLYTPKDQLKANIANKFIGRGSSRSSTAAYAKAYGSLANCGEYNATDVVFISAEGARTGRLSIDVEEIKTAAKAKVKFVTDNKDNRLRPYNCGEREVAQLLTQLGYTDHLGQWSLKN